MKFNMSIEDNYVSFIDEATGVAVFVDSFNNKQFEVRVGSVTESESAGSIMASSSDELNQKLEEIFRKFRGEK